MGSWSKTGGLCSPGRSLKPPLPGGKIMHAHDLCDQPFVPGLLPTCDGSFPSQGKVFRDALKPHNLYLTFPFMVHVRGFPP